MATTEQLLNGAKNKDPTIKEFIRDESQTPSSMIKNYLAIRTGSDANTLSVEFFQVIVRNEGQATEQAFFVDRCPCSAGSQAARQKGAFETWMDDQVNVLMASDSTIQRVFVEYIDLERSRGQLLVIKETASGIRKIPVFAYADKTGAFRLERADG